MISRFFIERPRFAFVISIVITLAGLISIFTLPVAQYPNITPSQISVTTTYPGADARTVQETVIQPIEAQLNGVKRMLYISSTATDTGMATINVTFDIGTDGDQNTVNTQNRVNWASAQMPEEVRRQSVIVKEKSSNMLQVIALYSPKGTYDSLFLSNYGSINLKDELARIPGVGDVQMLGELKYSMRIWLDSDKLAYLNMTVDDVVAAIKAQNVQFSAGALGDAPTSDRQVFRYSLQTQGRFTEPKEFENIVIRSTSAGEQVRLRDVAKVEPGAENYSSSGSFNGRPAALLAIYQLNDANGLEIAEAARKKLEELKVYFPEDLGYAIPFDMTDFITASIDEVVVTLIEAVLPVILITYLFLQDWRSTLVPTIAIPVSLIGTFAVMAVIGYSINLITLFGLILAIGVVVDDAVVVIENVNRLMEEEHLDPKAAAIKSMEQVTGPVIATTLVLLAMFIPVCFLPGITGEMYRQFGITISVAVAISSVNALTLSPALSAMILRPIDPNAKKFIFFRWFDAGFEKLTAGYGKVVSPLVRRTSLMIVCYAGLAFLCVQLFNHLPTGFIPDAASLNRTTAVTDRAAKLAAEVPGVIDVIAVLLAVPIAFFGSLLSLYLAGIDNNIYTQVGFVLLFGIACKTAILIVEFAKNKYDEGTPLYDAALAAARLRFRAVLMTAVSFLLGTLPLVIATGAGAASRRSLGTAVFGGMFVAVIGGTILIPAFYVLVQRLVNWAGGTGSPRRAPRSAEPPAPARNSR